MDAPPRVERAHLDRICTSIRGKLQFMDYLVRAAAADVERFQAEGDSGTQIFLKQLIEMHATTLAQECDNMRQLAELCGQLNYVVGVGPNVTGPMNLGATSPVSASTSLRMGGLS